MRAGVVVAIVFSVLTGVLSAKERPRPNAPTFNRDVAPIVFTHCVGCHHPGGTAPFSLATYADVKKRAKLIARVTGSRYMPPWLPEPGHGKFIGERRLSDDEIATLDRWAKAGAPQGAAPDLKVKPQWPDGWQLGTPDLVITLPEPFWLPAGGEDVYRNFVIPGSIDRDRFLRAVEFRPGPTTAIHHAFVLLEHTGQARLRAASQTEPGFPGMDTAGAGSPEGMFLSWQPGKQASEAPPGVATLVQANTDFVLQLHMQPTGKREKIQPTVALYFTDQPPTRAPFIALLRSVDIDIAAGATDYAIEGSYRLPVDVELVSILPHLHYLGKELRAWAELPDGSRRELLWIKQWDFNWQGDYRFAEPELLPKGSTIRMRYTYDNSAGNPRNPHQPPRRVTYGLESDDEMGELWLQLIPRDPAEREVLKRDYIAAVGLPDSISWARAMLRKNPKDAARRSGLAASLLSMGKVDEAKAELEQAVADDPALAEPHHLLAHLYVRQNDVPRAKAALQRSVELDGKNFKSQNDFGFLLLSLGEIDRAIEHLEKAVALNPNDGLAQRNLARARAAKKP